MKGKLFAITGHSGSGKTTTMRMAMGTKKEIVSVTTRNMREGEVEGVDYYFVDNETFYNMKLNDELAEYTDYYGSSNYGVTKTEIDSKLSRGDAYIIVDYHGFKQLKALYPDLVGIFIYTDKDTAEKRMKSRGDSMETIDIRLSTYEAEMMNKHQYDYVLKNVNFNKTVIALSAITQAEATFEIPSLELNHWSSSITFSADSIKIKGDLITLPNDKLNQLNRDL
jgi:guanylate kinase